MTNDDYRAFLTYLFDNYARPRLHRASHYSHGPGGSEFAYEFERMRRTAHLTRFI
jgi:hypothetical protein